MLAAPLSAAERIKTLFGAALGDLEAGTDVIAVPQMGEEGDDSALRVPRSMLTRIIQARLDDIFEEVQKRLQASGFDVAAGRRAGADRRGLPVGGHPRTGGAHPEQAGANRPAADFPRPGRRQCRT